LAKGHLVRKREAGKERKAIMKTELKRGKKRPTGRRRRCNQLLSSEGLGEPEEAADPDSQSLREVTTILLGKEGDFGFGGRIN